MLAIRVLTENMTGLPIVECSMATAAAGPPGPPPPRPPDRDRPLSDATDPDLPPDVQECDRCGQIKSLAHFVHLKHKNKLVKRCLACREQMNAPATIQREHRVQRRSGEEPSPAPSLSQLVDHHDSPTTSSYGGLASGSGALASGSGNRGRHEEDDSFTCDTCGIRRPRRCHYQGSNTCIYCPDPGRDEDGEEQACLSCLRVFFRREFQGSSGEQRVYCRSCHRELNQDDDGESVAPTSSVADSDLSLSTTSVSSRLNNGRRRPVQTRGQSASSQPLPVPSPAFIPDPPFVEGDLDNNLDPGEVPEDLPELTQVEEMLIARVHVHVQVMTYRGQQYKSKRHVINFLKDVDQVYRQLPLLPQDLDIIILRPSNHTNQPHMIRQFRNQYRVRQQHVRTWLELLRINHPGYRNIVMDEVHLSQLPQDGDVSDQLITELIDPEEIDDFIEDDALPDPDDWDAAAIPNFVAKERDLTFLRNRLQGRPDQPSVPLEPADEPCLEMPAVWSTPLNQFNRSQPPAPPAPPTLFPRGEADFVEPRQRGVQYAEYTETLMKYHDGRFARHPRFPYVPFNTLMRQQINQRSTFFIKKDGHRQPADVDQLRQAFNSNTLEAKALLNLVVRYSGSLRGTCPYRGGRRYQLEAYVHGLGCPGVFLTFSLADLHWDSFARVMPHYDEWLAGDNRREVVIARSNLRENPHIAAYHFFACFNAFLKHVLIPKFGITDYCAWNPDRDQAGQVREDNPLITIIPNPTFKDLGAVVNRVQRHMCTATYCQRRKRLNNGQLSAETSCRFHFPRETHTHPILSRNLNPNYPVYDGARNDTQLNNFNRTIIISWLANIDVSPCTSSSAVINYVVKYVGKAEKKSESYKDIAKAILPRVNSNRGIVGFVAKFMNILITERDWPAQEINHLLLNLDLQQGTRVVQNVDCRHSNQHWKADFVPADGEDSVVTAKNTYQKYLGRPDGLKDCSYFFFLTRIDFSGRPQSWREFPQAPDRILNYFPRYSPSSEHEDHARVKLMLHHPHNDFDELLTVEGETFETFVDAYLHCRFVHAGAHPNDYFGIIGEDILEEEFEEDPDEEDEVPQEAWQELAGLLPQDQLDTEDMELLGNRPLDHAYDWDSYIGKFPELCVQKREYWKNLRQHHSQTNIATDLVDPDTLNEEQRLVYDLFVNHSDATIDPNQLHPQPLLAQVDGQGGTGKSYLIHALSTALNARSADCVARMANVKHTTLDEKSMVGLRTFHYIDQRLRQIFPMEQHKYFGGRSILLLGNFYQLPPVFEKPLYFTGILQNELKLAGRNAYYEFDSTVQLQQVVRQQGSDQAPFRNALQGLRSGKPIPDHWQLLCSRVQSKLTDDEIATFHDAVRIYPTNQQVRDFNRDHMERLRQAVILIHASHGNQFGNDVESQAAGNLLKTLPLCTGARVMLTENI
ncbi:hypothetical protein MRS44_015208 [Fusarium solani]|uniref:uncharacterized protein n=1 Tax=Fusarium solani TaxID=169388 RepID=UPI0032C491C4|nr:hypothetical protein MRS44_015208 [Fusarium solani]